MFQISSNPRHIDRFYQTSLLLAPLVDCRSIVVRTPTFRAPHYSIPKLKTSQRKRDEEITEENWLSSNLSRDTMLGFVNYAQFSLFRTFFIRRKENI